ncbi:SPOR domain-containing protein [Pseudodesulfovibrio sp. zrk46]|uniref:SPOR domain-containing protein n=1 Tax=Pseudodesulfovibrio sp. zrk46 TaxID=2725288 RepID=UPI001449988A|nr:SPOR domain-containing protein [Pseudodesulfovibrio sp. zrk46]QJB55243.1 tetratricopeptide repeat protein [Pseudodesulfovibrio sp. zrk46]
MSKSIHIIIAILGILLLTGCATKSKQHDQTFEEFAYGEEGPVKLSAEQHEQVADGYLRRGNDEMAFVHMNKALELEPENLDIRVKKGDLLVRKGLDEQALAEFINALEADPDHAIANGSAGAVYFRAGLYKEARLHLEKSIKLNPMLWKSHNYLGILNDKDGNYKEAADNFATAIDLNQNGDTSEIYNNLGVVHIAQKQYGLAVDAFRRALKNGGVSARTYNNLGLALTRLGRLEEALESFKYAGGESKANNNLGYVLLSDDKPDKAIPYFERAIELSPNFYVMAAENLKRARLAARFQQASNVVDNNQAGSTPNPLLRRTFPKAEQNPGGPAASPAPAGPPSGDIQKISLPPVSGHDIEQSVTYGLHVSSWRDHKWAFNHCEQLRKQGYTTWINQVDLKDKGIWYRVLVGKFASIRDAQQARPDVLTVLDLDRAAVYQRIAPSPDGSHL